VKNANSGSDYIYAQYNYWGTPFPKPDDFSGNVQYQPYLQNPPNNKNNTAEGESFIPDADDYVNYFNYTGTEYYAQEKYEQAIADFEFVMINYPDSSQARYALTHVVKCLQAMEKSEEIVPYLDKQMEEYKSHSDFYSFIVFKSVPYLVRNGLYEQAVERIKKLQDVYEKDKDMGAYLQFNLATIYRSCLLDTTNAIAVLTAFLEQYEHQDLTPIAKIELEMLGMMDNSFAKRTPQQASTMEVPTSFTLSQNYPNPFNPQTAINYQLAKKCVVFIKIYNLLGHEVRTLVNEHQSAGNYSLVWDGHDNIGRSVSSGVYVYRIAAGEFSEVRKMVLMQ